MRSSETTIDTGNYALVIHGGAGTILKERMTSKKEAAYKAALTQALQAGYDILKKGGNSLDAVEAAVIVMEDSPLFNAGKGSVFTNEGKNEMDAAIMDGKSLMAGSVASVTTIKNPIIAAKTVMLKSPHVMMIGAGAEKFAKEQGLNIVDPSYFYTKERWEQLQNAKEKDKIQLDHTDSIKSHSFLKQPENHDYKYGTVGACALDIHGNLAAATSTGGMTNKRFGRVGDAPIIGAGTYANNNSCAVSCTGWGEFFIRNVVAHDVAALVEYKGLNLKDAAEEVVMKKVPALGGDGGLIAIDRKGNIAMPFNTAGMYRGYVKKDGQIVVEIYK
ncbi:isoaspartyl peptidase/L-asparaginase family protein [Solitalea lacus]|uniref:isoaspartyl peptidase/L-asparaginase family protein n=1 Tax=Solitalea lacus TaxID=2911172 RepID=UPI001EDB1BCD|nr:isoaspartyl peptidase/L-asparaginase [Solitalea lacus]UKJ07293.1 isoaspartyl peptidase/L-asparaginase [Solitalea lacus]